MFVGTGDTVTGGNGTDTANLIGNRADYTVTETNAAVFLTDITGGSVQFLKTTGVNTTETFRFNDQTVSLADLLSGAGANPGNGGGTPGGTKVAVAITPGVGNITAAAAGERFTFDVVAARQDAAMTNTDRTINGFAPGTAASSDVLSLDVSGAGNPNITNLAQLQNFGAAFGISVDNSLAIFGQPVLIDFGPDSNGMESVVIRLAGIPTDLSQVAVTVV